MKLTRSSAYALTAMACLARDNSGGLVPSHALAAQATEIPERFLLKLLLPLVTAGILLPVRGPGGGYKLRAAGVRDFRAGRGAGGGRPDPRRGA